MLCERHRGPGDFYITLALRFVLRMRTTDRPTKPISNRQMRNQAEKMRRDKLNTYISELATQVPMVAHSPKRTDKISILRLTAAYILMDRRMLIHSRNSGNSLMNSSD
ncbi:unnamed protein product [Timema podura]|uniref:BHLH domain-containing protein n=1 Tax=Timema podura TaxID=61482 RepID=A0ABN7NGP6_TIMPD|nr:unnamed protein product [Timema podura]